MNHILVDGHETSANTVDFGMSAVAGMFALDSAIAALPIRARGILLRVEVLGSLKLPRHVVLGYRMSLPMVRQQCVPGQ